MIVVDTCVVIWAALSPRRLTDKAKKVMEEADKTDRIYLCDITLWEIAMLIRKGRLDPGTSYSQFIDLMLQSHRYQVVPIDPEIADTAVNLPREVNQDPADRLIAATSLVKKVPLVTGDRGLLEAQCLKTVW